MPYALRPALREPWPYFALAFAVAAAGFWPSFFAVLPSIDAPRLIHGASATAWMVLPIAQAWLIRSRRRRLHRAVGYFSLALAALVVISGLQVVQHMVLRNIDDFQIRRIKFVLLDLTGLALFCVFLAAAIWSARKRDVGLHVRLLACTALIPLEAALERLLHNLLPSIVPDLHTGLYAALFSMEAICVALIFAEWRLDRIRWPFAALLTYYVALHVVASPVAASPAFQEFSWWFAGLGAAASPMGN